MSDREPILSHEDRARSDSAKQFHFRQPSTRPPRLLTKQELAHVLNVSPRTIDNWIAQRRIPFLRFSSRLMRFDLLQVQSAIERYEIREIGRRL
jgi:excisionase family DNA binding protein